MFCAFFLVYSLSDGVAVEKKKKVTTFRVTTTESSTLISAGGISRSRSQRSGPADIKMCRLSAPLLRETRGTFKRRTSLFFSFLFFFPLLHYLVLPMLRHNPSLTSVYRKLCSEFRRCRRGFCKHSLTATELCRKGSGVGVGQQGVSTCGWWPAETPDVLRLFWAPRLANVL